MTRAEQVLETVDTARFREVAKITKSTIKADHRGVDVRVSMPTKKGVVKLSIANPYMTKKDVEAYADPLRKLGYKVTGKIHCYP